MKYYEVALPLKLEKFFTYTSLENIQKGCRVLVSFGNTMKTGIVWGKSSQREQNIKYKNIIEIIDEKSLINDRLLDLAEWISDYYQSSLGTTLFSMLPAGINIHLQQKIIKVKDGFLKESDGTPERILNEISAIVKTDIQNIKEKLKVRNFYYWIEKLELAGLIDIERTYDAKIKKKIANFVVFNNVKEFPKLTNKQREVYDKLSSFGKDFPLSEIAKDFSYSIVKTLRNKGLLQIEPREVKSPQKKIEKKTKKHINLTDEQQHSINKISEPIGENIFQTFLLFGITGSGKTEVYIEVIRKALNSGKTALMLVPEISLTPQTVDRFRSSFDDDIAILHSHLNDRERWEQWNKIRSGKSRIVIGARSAIFAPLENIGVIIVDEEHEHSYKQDKTPRYNGRDMAIVRAQKTKAVVILGSATPSLESWHNVSTGKYQLLELKKRPLNICLPTVKIKNMCLEGQHKDILSKELMQKIEQKLNRKEQVILLQNRRGHSSFVQCVTCGKLFKCKDCEISMNYHSSSMNLICHYCGYTSGVPRKCSDCGSFIFSYGAPGTQQIEKQLKVVFPTARILRMDSDTTHKKDSYNSMFDRMRNGNIDILLGTQMISKGLDFANVTLVGVVSADLGLGFPDFRAAERTFQLLTQVAGRSGRGDKKGEVIIQTYNPEHYAIECAMNQDFESFANKELSYRKTLHYPPFYRISRFVFSHENQKFLIANIDKNRKIFNHLKTQFDPIEINFLGPTPTPLVKLFNKYRYHIILKSKSARILKRAVNILKENLDFSNSIKMIIDTDPFSLM